MAKSSWERSVHMSSSGANLTSSIRTKKMRRTYSFLLMIITASCAAHPAMGQSLPRPPKPYAPVAITRPGASDDASFMTFRTALAATAKSRIYAALAPLVLTQGFFWDRDFSRLLDPRRPAVDNLAAAIALEQGNGSGWDALAVFATEAAVEALESRPGVVCAPARPGYDGVAFSRLLETTYTGGIDWAYPRADETLVHSAPQPGAAKIGSLGPHFVRLMGFEGPDNDSAVGRKQWAQIALPDGGPGFVAPGHLMSLTTERLCYIKDLVGGWRIAGYIGGGK
jgi:hypothetical protein